MPIGQTSEKMEILEKRQDNPTDQQSSEPQTRGVMKVKLSGKGKKDDQLVIKTTGDRQ
jgi:hypothetical protein